MFEAIVSEIGTISVTKDLCKHTHTQPFKRLFTSWDDVSPGVELVTHLSLRNHLV